MELGKELGTLMKVYYLIKQKLCALGDFFLFFFCLFSTRSEVGQVFALSWLITWYGHVLKDFSTIVRLYDFFLATHPLMPVYFGAAVSFCVVPSDTAADCFSTVSVKYIGVA